MSLNKSIAKNSAWSLLERGGQQVISFFIFIIIARILGPEEYGLAMLCFVLLALANDVISGMADGVITLQMKVEDGRSLSDLFWIIIVIGSFFSAVFCFFSEYFAAFFEHEELKVLICYFSIVPILIAAQAIPSAIVMKEMNFKVYAIRSLFSTVVSGAVALVMAVQGFGALALIIQQIVLFFSFNIILWFSISWRPSFSFNINSFLDITRPGFRMVLSNSLVFIEQQLPRFFIGFFMGLINVGYYSFAFRMRYALHDILINPFFAVLFPALSKINKSKIQQNELLSNVIFLIGLFAFPCITMAVITAPIYVPLFLGEKWVGAIFILQLFLALGYVVPFTKLAEVVFRANNKVNILLRGQFLVTILGSIGVYFSSQQSLIAVGCVIVLYNVISFPVYFYLLFRATGISLYCYLKVLIKSFFATLVTGLVTYGLVEYLQVDDNFFHLLISVALGFSVYIGLSLMFQYEAIINAIKYYRS
jgi:O-antigen/teichoic acid export membrane protein